MHESVCVTQLTHSNTVFYIAMSRSAILHDPTVSQFPVPLGSSTEGYEVMHNAPLSLTMRDEVSLHVLNTQHSHMQSYRARQDT